MSDSPSLEVTETIRRKRAIGRLCRWREHANRSAWARDFARSKTGAYLVARKRAGRAVVPFDVRQLGYSHRDFSVAVAGELLALVVTCACDWQKPALVATLAQLAELLDCSESSVARAIAELAGAGLVDARAAFGAWRNVAGVLQFFPGQYKADGRTQDQGPNMLAAGELLRSSWRMHQRARIARAEIRNGDDPSDPTPKEEREKTGRCRRPVAPESQGQRCSARGCVADAKAGWAYCSRACSRREHLRRSESRGSRANLAPNGSARPAIASTPAPATSEGSAAETLPDAFYEALKTGDFQLALQFANAGLPLFESKP